MTALDLLRSVTAERDRARELAATLEEELARIPIVRLPDCDYCGKEYHRGDCEADA